MRVLLAALVLALALMCSRALGDADPASDVLIGENVFYPYSPLVSADLQKALNGETAAAARAHFPIKVALIFSPPDLGALTQLFGRPQQYAAFLDQEFGFLSNPHPPLLVVMARGYGVAGLPAASTAAARALPAPGGNHVDALARAAIAAVQKLAAAAGHPLPRVSTAGSGAGGSRALVIVAVAAAALCGAGAVIAGRRVGGRARWK